MTGIAATENRATIARTTCGWPKPDLEREAVRRFWRDVHSPAISRRRGIYQYRHSPFDPVEGALFEPVDGIELDCRVDEQIQWQSNVVYLDEAGMDEFVHSPPDPEVTSLLLSDIELIVDKSTTYKALGDNQHTYLDRSGNSTPVGPVTSPTYGVFFRTAVEEAPFRQVMRELAAQWAQSPGVTRVRLNLFEAPDMEAERKAGYPVKTHPEELQYQAWIDLRVEDEGAARSLLADNADSVRGAVRTVHAYPVPAVYTFVWEGRPTLAGLRGVAAYEAILALDADHQVDERLLEWMYGPVVKGLL